MQKQSFFSFAVYKYTVLFSYYPPSGASSEEDETESPNIQTYNKDTWIQNPG